MHDVGIFTKMKLVAFIHDHQEKIGVLAGEEIADLSQARVCFPDSIMELLSGGDEMLAAARAAVNTVKIRIPLEQVRLRAPLLNPRNFIALGLAYHSHKDELRNSSLNISIPDNLFWFRKNPRCIIGPDDPIQLSKVFDNLDYEGELAVVIGKRCRNVRADEAEDIIIGYMVTNDFVFRDMPMSMQLAPETPTPTGPWLTCKEEVGKPENLWLRTWVDNELRQDGNTDDLIYGIGEIIAQLTEEITLEPGDIVSTGTPSGVGAGYRPPRYLSAGQSVKVEIEGLGFIENKIVS